MLIRSLFVLLAFLIMGPFAHQAFLEYQRVKLEQINAE